jgi:hypothetical protein
MNVNNTAILAILLAFAALPGEGAALSITDNFNTMNTTIWGCEYACPTVSGGIAQFNIDPGSLNTNTTWSKLVFKNRKFGYGTYSMTFKYNRRPLEAEVWAGWALYSETSSGLVNEINFGIETACISRCNDQTLILESYKNSNNSEVVVPLGVSLFNGTWHTATLTYTATKISLDFDGKQMASITDQTKIPTEAMELIPGARVVSGTLDSRFSMDVDSMSISDSIRPSTPVNQNRPVTIRPVKQENVHISIFNAAGKELGTFANSDTYTRTSNVAIPGHIKGSGVYIIRITSGNSVSCRKIIVHKQIK